MTRTFKNLAGFLKAVTASHWPVGHGALVQGMKGRSLRLSWRDVKRLRRELEEFRQRSRPSLRLKKRVRRGKVFANPAGPVRGGQDFYRRDFVGHMVQRPAESNWYAKVQRSERASAGGIIPAEIHERLSSKLELSEPLRPARRAKKKKRSPTGVIQYTPQLATPKKIRLQPRSEFDATVFLDQGPAKDDAQRRMVRIPDDAVNGQYPLTVEFAVSRHFHVIDGAVRSITVQRGQARSTSAVFRIRRSSVTLPKDGGMLEARFYRNKHLCGWIKRRLGAAPGRGRTVEIERNVVSPPDATLPEPDAVVHVRQLPASRDYELRVFCPGVPDLWERMLIDQTLSNSVTGALKLVELQPPGTTSMMTALLGLGNSLYDSIMPANFRTMVDVLLKRKQPSLLIMTDEAVIPWELLVRKVGPAVESAPIGTRIVMGRWQTGLGHPLTHPRRLTGAFVGVGDSNPPLEFADRELAAIEKSFAKATEFRATTEASLRAAMARQDHPVVHFIGHGDDEPGAHVLKVGDELLSDLHINGDGRLQKQFAKVRPFVFLNACMAARPQVRFHGVIGLPQSFLKAGASAVVAPNWSVDDQHAYRVARQFYQAVRSNAKKPLAAIVRDLRKRSYAGPAGEDTWAAYAFFGHPLAYGR